MPAGLQRLDARGVESGRTRVATSRLILIPMWDPALAAKEMERCAAKGSTAFAFSENPAPLDLPTIHDKDRYWDPVMSAASELQMVPVCTWALLHRCPRSRPTLRSWPIWPGGPSAPREPCCPGCSVACSPGTPSLEDRSVRRGDRLDAVFPRACRAGARQAALLGAAGRHVHGACRDGRGPRHDRRARALSRPCHIGCFIDDAHGIASIDEIGVDNIMCETDYPHSDSTWPNCIAMVKRQHQSSCT